MEGHLKLIVLGIFVYFIITLSSTYAYYYFSSSNNNTIAGDMANADLDLTVERVVPTSEQGLVPLIDSHLDKALKGTGGVSSCIDGNNNLSCEVYKITIY